MLSRARTLSKRLDATVRRAYLRWRIHEARKDANAIEGELLTAPARLRATREFITANLRMLRDLEGAP